MFGPCVKSFSGESSFFSFEVGCDFTSGFLASFATQESDAVGGAALALDPQIVGGGNAKRFEVVVVEKLM